MKDFRSDRCSGVSVQTKLVVFSSIGSSDSGATGECRADGGGIDEGEVRPGGDPERRAGDFHRELGQKFAQKYRGGAPFDVGTQRQNDFGY